MPALATFNPYAQFVAGVLVAALGVAAAGTVVGHAIDPAHIGLWSGPQAFFFGKVDDAAFARAADAHQLPDGTLYVVAAMLVVLCWFVSRELFGFARAGLKRQQR
jgi:hypothetical protein